MRKLLSVCVMSGILSVVLVGCAVQQEGTTAPTEESTSTSVSASTSATTTEDSSSKGDTTSTTNSSTTATNPQPDVTTTTAYIPYTKNSDGTYSYTVAGYTVTTKENVNDYIVVDGKYTCYRFCEQAINNGWTIKDNSTEKAYCDGGQIILHYTNKDGDGSSLFIDNIEPTAANSYGSIMQGRCADYSFRLYNHHTLQISTDMIVLTAYALENAQTATGNLYQPIFGDNYISASTYWIPAA